MAHPSSAGTINHVNMKRTTKQGSIPGRDQQLPFEVENNAKTISGIEANIGEI